MESKRKKAHRKLKAKSTWTNLLSRMLLIILASSINFSILGFPLQTAIAAADRSPHVLKLEQQDLNSDGRPDVTLIDADFITSYPKTYLDDGIREKARITVYDGGSDMEASSDWRKATDFIDDTWVFDVGMDGKPDLVIVFKQEQGKYVAYIYTDVNGDGMVSIQVTGKHVEVTESKYWTSKVVSDTPWATQDGKVNNFHTMDFYMDGYPLRGFGLQNVENFPKDLRQKFATDGVVDFRDRVVESNADGIPDYEWLARLTSLPYPYDESNNYLCVNAGKHRPEDYPDAIFWPLLVTSHGNAEVYRYFDHTPGVFMDWSTDRIWEVGVVGYPIERGYHINTMGPEPFIESVDNYANFENPMAYYDLANDYDGYPDLFIRLENFEANDPIFLNGTIPDPMVRVTYAWDQNNDNRWDYELSLAGKYPVDTEINLPGLSFRSVPYDEIPTWVTGKRWDIAMLVAAQTTYQYTSEGIYSWGVGEGEKNGKRVYSPLFEQYLTGLSSHAPDEYYQEIQAGLRGEYTFTLSDYPNLYFSPIDRKLHLRGAKAGTWNIDDQHAIRYANLDGGAYLDQWQYFDQGKLQSQLVQSGTYLLYTGNNEVQLQKINTAPSIFETLPPTNHEEWLALGNKLETYGEKFAPGDFKSMMAQFSGPSWHISGANLRDFRKEGDGFRFILELQPNFHAEGESGPDLTNFQPGTYVVWYDGSFHVEKSTPPNLSASIQSASLIALEQNPIPVSVRNNGLEDLPNAELQIWATSPEGNTSEVITQTVTVLAQSIAAPLIQWAPRSPGHWTLTPVLRQPDGQRTIGSSAQIAVLPAQPANFASLVPLSVPGKLVPFIVIGLISFAFIGSLTFLRAWKRYLSEEK